MGLLFGGNLIRWIDRWGLSLELTITRKEQFNSNSRENRNMAGMRQWTRLRSETSSGTIRLATYNILAQHYVDTMPHLYQHCFRSKKSHLLQWINRKWFHIDLSVSTYWCFGLIYRLNVSIKINDLRRTDLVILSWNFKPKISKILGDFIRMDANFSKTLWMYMYRLNSEDFSKFFVSLDIIFWAFSYERKLGEVLKNVDFFRIFLNFHDFFRFSRGFSYNFFLYSELQSRPIHH